MPIIIAIFIFLLTTGLLINTVRAYRAGDGQNYNSSKSNTSSIMIAGGLGEGQAAELLERFETLGDIMRIDEDRLSEELTAAGIAEDKAQNILSDLRENAAQEYAAQLTKPRFLPSSPFYFLKRWGEAVEGFFAFSPQAKARLQLKHAQSRLAEVNVMLAKKEVDAQVIAIATARLEKNMEKAAAIVEEESAKGRDVSAIAKELNVGFGTQRVFLESKKGEFTKGDLMPDYDTTMTRFDLADEKFEKASEGTIKNILPSGRDTKAPTETPTPPAIESKTEIIEIKDGDDMRVPTPAAPPAVEQPAVQRPAGDQEGAVSTARKNYNSSISNTHSVGKIREVIGDMLISYGIGGAEINRVTDALERGIEETALKSLLSEIGVSQGGIDVVLLKLNEMGARFQ